MGLVLTFVDDQCEEDSDERPRLRGILARARRGERGRTHRDPVHKCVHGEPEGERICALLEFCVHSPSGCGRSRSRVLRDALGTFEVAKLDVEFYGRHAGRQGCMAVTFEECGRMG